MPLPNLRVPRKGAEKQIEARIQKGREIRDATDLVFFSERDLERGRNEKSKWVKYTRDLLETLFDNTSVADEFDPRGGMVAVGAGRTFEKQTEELRESMDRYIVRLESIHERLDLAPEHILAFGAVAVALITIGAITLKAVDPYVGSGIIASLVRRGAIAEVIKAKKGKGQ